MMTLPASAQLQLEPNWSQDANLWFGPLYRQAESGNSLPSYLAGDFDATSVGFNNRLRNG
jgi:hypothetical protein